MTAKCPHYCPDCQTGNCPKINELKQELNTIGTEAADLVSGYELAVDAYEALRVMLEEAYVEIRELKAGDGVAGE
jgi:hypothetical protein